MSFNGDLYPTAGATSVMTTKGDMVDYDTARQRLGIGSANQILQVKSNLPSWETVPLADTVLTTQGDVLYEGASALARLGQSTDNFTLATKGAGANPAWQASATSVLTTTGDLLYASGANTLARLAGGTSGDVLTANGAGVAPSYQTAGGGGAWELLGSQTATSGTASIGVTGMTVKDILCIVLRFEQVTNSTSAFLRVNGVTTGTYTTRYLTNTSLNTQTSSTGFELVATHDDHMVGYTIYLIQPDSNLQTGGTQGWFNGNTIDQNSPQTSYCTTGGMYQPQTSDITQVDALWSSGNCIGEITVFGANKT